MSPLAGAHCPQTQPARPSLSHRLTARPGWDQAAPCPRPHRGPCSHLPSHAPDDGPSHTTPAATRPMSSTWVTAQGPPALCTANSPVTHQPSHTPPQSPGIQGRTLRLHILPAPPHSPTAVHPGLGIHPARPPLDARHGKCPPSSFSGEWSLHTPVLATKPALLGSLVPAMSPSPPPLRAPHPARLGSLRTARRGAD